MFDHAAQPQSTDEWLTLARQDQQAAFRLANDAATAGRAWDHAGHAVECVLKAAIMARSGMNQWPPYDVRPELYTHDLSRLAIIAGIVIDPRGPSLLLGRPCFSGDGTNPTIRGLCRARSSMP